MAVVLLLGEALPSDHELVQVLLEHGDEVVLRQVVVLELLDDDQDEEVQHDVWADQDQQVEVPERVGCIAAAVQLRDAAIFGGPRAVVHDLVPVLACGQGKEQQKGAAEVGEVLQFIDDISSSDLPEEEIAKNWKHKENDDEQNENVEQRWNGKLNSLQYGLQARVFASQFQNPGDSHNTRDPSQLGESGEPGQICVNVLQKVDD